MSPDQKGIETTRNRTVSSPFPFTMSPDQKGIETVGQFRNVHGHGFTMSPDQKGIETRASLHPAALAVHNEPRSKGD